MISFGECVVGLFFAVCIGALVYRMASRGATWVTVTLFILLASVMGSVAWHWYLVSQRPTRPPVDWKRYLTKSERSEINAELSEQSRAALEKKIQRAKRIAENHTAVDKAEDDERIRSARAVSLMLPSSLLLGLVGGAALGLRKRKQRLALGEGNGRPLVADIEGFVSMLAAACENASMQGTLERLLSLPDAERREELGKLVAELRERRAPKELVDAFICLQDDSIAERAYVALYHCTRDGKPVAAPRPA